MRLRMTRRMRTYTNVTDADIARQIADAHRPGVRRRRRRARGSTWCSRSTRATWPSCANGPGGSRPSCGARAGPCTSAPGTGARAPGCSWSGAGTCCRSGCWPISPTSAARCSSPATTRRRRGGRRAGGRRGGRRRVRPGRTGPQVVAMALGPSREQTAEAVAADLPVPRRRPVRGAGAGLGQGGDAAPGPRRSSPSRRLTRGSPELVVGSIVELQDVGQPFRAAATT